MDIINIQPINFKMSNGQHKLNLSFILYSQALISSREYTCFTHIRFKRRAYNTSFQLSKVDQIKECLSFYHHSIALQTCTTC